MERRRALAREFDRSLPHLVITGITPVLDGGRYPVKRVVHEELGVEADIFKDGQDILAARVGVRAPGEPHGQSVPMRYSFERDRWGASVLLDRTGEWWFALEAWVDRFATWRGELEKKVGAGLDVGSELLEGAELVRQAEPHARGEDHGRLAGFAAILGDPAGHRSARVAGALSTELQALMAAYGLPEGLTQGEREYAVRVDPPDAAFAAWYEFFPRSATTDPARHFRRRGGRAPPNRGPGLRRRLPPAYPPGRADTQEGPQQQPEGQAGRSR
jgi:starch synthase (maltosyl-transferring)